MESRISPVMPKAVRPRLKRGQATTLLVGLALTILTSSLYMWQPSFLQFLDHKLYDVILKANHNQVISNRICIVKIDEASLSEFGQWPWPRYRLATLIDKIRQAGARSIGMDMIYAEPDRTSLGIIKADIARDLNIDINLEDLPPMLLDNDKTLADALARDPVVLGYRFIFEDGRNAHRIGLLHPVNVGLRKTLQPGKPSRTLFNAESVVSNIDILAESAQSSGFINAVADIDGIVRRAPLLIENDGQYYPSLAMAMLLRFSGIKQLFLSTTPNGVSGVRMGETDIPTDARGNLLIHYRGEKQTFESISAGDILKDRVPEERFTNKIVLLGASVTALADLRTTPLDRFYPGVEVHATIIDNILQKDFLSIPNWIGGLQFFLVIAFGTLSTVLLSLTRALWCAAILGLCLLGIWVGADWQFASRGLFISPLFPLITIIANFFILTLLKFWHEERRVKARNLELTLTQHATIRSLVSLAETRDNDTGGHIRRTQQYVRILALRLKDHPKFSSFLDDETIDLLYMSAPLHDAGKVGIPDNILLKPGKLDTDEFERMKDHTVLGGNAIKRAEEELGERSFLRFAREIAYSHQEKWDGSGYPEGLKGEEIPISGRVMAIADVYDALISRRVYKKPFPHHVAVNAIAMGKGSHFDPDMIDAFLKVKDEFRRIAIELSDTEEQRRILLQTEDA